MIRVSSDYTCMCSRVRPRYLLYRLVSWILLPTPQKGSRHIRIQAQGRQVAIYFDVEVVEVRDMVDLLDLVISIECSHLIHSQLMTRSHQIFTVDSQIKCR